MPTVAVLKTGALGDVLRTTSILPGLAHRYPGRDLVWVTAPDAVDLVRSHPLVTRVVAADPAGAGFVESAAAELAHARLERVLSFDDERPVCRLAARLAAVAPPGALSGAFEDERGELRYTADTAPWFDMGLLSVHGRARADELKRANRRSHAAIFAAMLGIEPDRPRLDLDPERLARADEFLTERGVRPGERRWVGLNTGAGGRWTSKRLSVERTAELAVAVDRARPGEVGFLLLGGPAEAERNARLGALLGERVRWVDAGVHHALLDFAALVDRLDVLVSSDSLALHVAVARRVPVVCFFAPTSAAEIELFGLGAKVASTAPDSCSYRPDADTSTLTVERLAPPVLEWLRRGRAE